MFAIAASAVDEIRNTQGLKPVPGTGFTSPGKVRYTLLRNGRKYFVVDAAVHFQMLPARATRLLVLRNAAVAALVGEIDRMTEITGIQALPDAFKGVERNWYRGLAVLESGNAVQVVPVVNAEALLGNAELEVLSKATVGAEAS